MANEPIKRTTQQARSGETRGNVRWVLLVSTLLAVAVMIWLALRTDTFATGNDESGPAPAAETR